MILGYNLLRTHQPNVKPNKTTKHMGFKLEIYSLSTFNCSQASQIVGNASIESYESTARIKS